MAGQKQVVIEISPGGNVKIEAQNYQGKGCADATAQIEIAIGGLNADKKTDKKPEFFNPVTSGTQTQTRRM